MKKKTDKDFRSTSTLQAWHKMFSNIPPRKLQEKTQIKKCQVLTCSLLKKKNLQLPKNFCIDWELTAPKQCLVWNRKSEWHGALHHFMYYIEAYTLHLNKPLNSYIIQSISSKNRQSIRLLQKALMAKSLFRLIIQ